MEYGKHGASVRGVIINIDVHNLYQTMYFFFGGFFFW